MHDIFNMTIRKPYFTFNARTSYTCTETEATVIVDQGRHHIYQPEVPYSQSREGISSLANLSFLIGSSVQVHSKPIR